ncbi:MAG: hypothetical protein ACQEVA_01200 [Myxococcota bacterium]
MSVDLHVHLNKDIALKEWLNEASGTLRSVLMLEEAPELTAPNLPAVIGADYGGCEAVYCGDYGAVATVTGPDLKKLRTMVKGMTLNAQDHHELGPWLAVDAYRMSLGFAAAFALAHAAAVLAESEIVDEWGHWFTGHTCAPESLRSIMTLPRRHEDLEAAADAWKGQLPKTCSTE